MEPLGTGDSSHTIASDIANRLLRSNPTFLSLQVNLYSPNIRGIRMSKVKPPAGLRALKPKPHLPAPWA